MGHLYGNSVRWNRAAVGLMLAVALIQIPVPDEQLRSFQRFLFEAGIGLILAAFVGHKVNHWVGAIVALCVVSWVLTTIKHGDPTVQRVAYLAKNAVMYGGVALLLFSIADEECLLWGMVLIATANFVFISLQTAGVDPFRLFTFGLVKSTWADPTGFMANKNETSALFAFSLFACIGGWRTLFLPVAILGLLLADSTGGVVAAACGACFLFHKRTMWPAAIAGLGAVLFVMYCDPSISNAFTERFRIWGLGNQGIGLNPVLGVGIGLWPLATNQLHAHNEFIQAWFELGFLVLIFLAGYVVSAWARMKDDALIPAAAVVTIFVNCAVSFPMHIAPLALMALAWVAIYETKLRGTQ